MKHAIVIEKVPGSSYLAYTPDLPGCAATGETAEEVERLMKSVLSSTGGMPPTAIFKNLFEQPKVSRRF